MAAYYKLGQDQDYPPTKWVPAPYPLLRYGFIKRKCLNQASTPEITTRTATGSSLTSTSTSKGIIISLFGRLALLVLSCSRMSTIVRNSPLQSPMGNVKRYCNLRNNNNMLVALPIDFSKVRSLAILGSDAGPNLDGPNGCSDRGCDQGTLAVGWGSGSEYFIPLPFSSFC